MFAMAMPALAFASSFPVTFVENVNSQDQTVTSQTSDIATALTLVANLTPKFANPGYAFRFWTTSADGSGAIFADGAIYNFAAGPLMLYAQWIENSVTFNENDSGSDTTHSTQSGHVAALLTLFSSLTPLFSNPGYAFAGWTTNANGSGTSYANGSSYDFTSGNLTLYAQWNQIPTENVVFVANGGSGSVTTLSGLQGSSVVLPGASTLSYANYAFTGWNTSSNGTGTSYGVGDPLILNSDVTLFAQWAADVFTLVYNLDGGSMSPTSVPFTFGTAALTLPMPTFQGHAFAGWFSAPSGGTLIGTDGTAYSPSSSISLYARWTLDTYVVAYVAGPGLVSPASVSFNYGASPLVLPVASSSGSDFLGWFSAPTGGVLVGVAAAPYTPSTSVVLYAQWHPSSLVTVSFDANGGTGGVSAMSGPVGSSIMLPGVTGLSHPGFTLVRWNTVANGTGTSFGSGTALTLGAPLTLFAQWTGHTPAVVLGAVGSFSGYTTSLTATLKKQSRRFASLIKNKRYTVVALYGYTTNTGVVSRNLSVSRLRANAVALYLRTQLTALHVKGVTIRTAGEGAIAGAPGASNRRVEVMVY